MTPLTTGYRIFVTISLVVSTSFGLLCRRMEAQTYFRPQYIFAPGPKYGLFVKRTCWLKIIFWKIYQDCAYF